MQYFRDDDDDDDDHAIYIYNRFNTVVILTAVHCEDDPKHKPMMCDDM